MLMVAHVSCLRSMINRRLGNLEDAGADASLALDFKLATSPPLAVAWAAAFSIEALTDLGRLDEAEAVAQAAADLRRAFAKLGITSRAGLPAQLAGQPREPA